MPESPPLNILILMGDQHRWDALGCVADGLPAWQRTWLMEGPGDRPLVQTPHLDRLAASGARFSQARASIPVCPKQAFLHHRQLSAPDWNSSPMPITGLSLRRYPAPDASGCGGYASAAIGGFALEEPHGTGRARTG